MKLDLYLIPYTKITSKWMRDLNVKVETTKFLEEHSGKTSDVGFGNYLLDLTPKAQETKIK